MKIEIDSDTMDGFVVASIKTSIKYLKWEMKHSSKEHTKLNIADWTESLDALEHVYRYYGGHLK